MKVFRTVYAARFFYTTWKYRDIELIDAMNISVLIKLHFNRQKGKQFYLKRSEIIY